LHAPVPTLSSLMKPMRAWGLTRANSSVSNCCPA
jgi:hypothetical protein